jgi:hypothetical protein
MNAACGKGGTNVHLIQWHQVDPYIVRMDRLESTKEAFAFWPGGGGFLEAGAGPSDGYYVVGSWTQWKNPTPMEKVNDTRYVSTVVMGINGFETFQIWVDGESDRVLHPGMMRAPSGCAVQGPSSDDDARNNNWMIDGRTHGILGASPAFPPVEGMPETSLAERDLLAVSTRDRGTPGDTYEISLLVAGKYRAVTWAKVEQATEAQVDDGEYYILSSWNDWQLAKMTPSSDGAHTLDIALCDTATEFQIVRNQDWDQRFYPTFSTMASASWDEFEACGPDDDGHGKNWFIKGEIGDVIRIEWQRYVKDGVDVKHISWHKLDL